MLERIVLWLVGGTRRTPEVNLQLVTGEQTLEMCRHALPIVTLLKLETKYGGEVKCST